MCVCVCVCVCVFVCVCVCVCVVGGGSFEGVISITTVNSSDIFGKFFDIKFFILENVIPQIANATVDDLSSMCILLFVNKICATENEHLLGIYAVVKQITLRPKEFKCWLLRATWLVHFAGFQ